MFFLQMLNADTDRKRFLLHSDTASQSDLKVSLAECRVLSHYYNRLLFMGIDSV